MLITFAIAGLIFSQLLSVPIWYMLTGKSAGEIQAAMLDPQYSNISKLTQALSQVGGFLLPTIITAWLIHKKPLVLLGFRGRISGEQVGLTFLIIIAALFLAASLSLITHLLPISPDLQLRFEKLEAEYSRQVQAIVRLNSFGDFLLALGVMAFIPALCEEALFRGGLQNFLTRGTSKPWMSIILVSILFSLAHWSFYGFLSRFVLGMVLGALYYYSGRLWISILAHFVNNGIALTIVYIYTRQGKPVAEAMSEGPESFWGLMTVPVLIVLLIHFRRISHRGLQRPY
ncbi:MAG: CPBP family intramembrane glutamic endopeptidase [Chitinophagaceae bacterium]